MVGIIKMPVHSNIVSPCIAPTRSWLSVPTKTQLYDQRAPICELPSADSPALVPRGSGRAKCIRFLILLFSVHSHVQKQKLKDPFGAFPKVNTKKFQGYFQYSSGIPINAVARNSGAAEEGVRDRRTTVLITLSGNGLLMFTGIAVLWP